MHLNTSIEPTKPRFAGFAGVSPEPQASYSTGTREVEVVEERRRSTGGTKSTLRLVGGAGGSYQKQPENCRIPSLKHLSGFFIFEDVGAPEQFPTERRKSYILCSTPEFSAVRWSSKSYSAVLAPVLCDCNDIVRSQTNEA